MKYISYIGLGKQNAQDHLKAALQNTESSLVAVCDRDGKVAKQVGKKLGIPSYSDYKKMIREHTIDAIIVAVPHNAYYEIVEFAAEHGIHVFKEKPIAIDLDEAIKMTKLASVNNIILTVAAQRRHNKIYQKFAEYQAKIGPIFSIHGEYTLNIHDLESGWRSSKAASGGGAVLDMGYHLIDLIVWYFGVPDRISADLGYKNRQDQNYDVEDSAKIQFSYKKSEQRILGSLLISRIYPQKDEGLSIYGMTGTIKIYKDRIELYDNERNLSESYFVKPNGADINSQFDHFIASLNKKDSRGNCDHHLKNMVFIDAIYRSDKDGVTISPATENKYKHIMEEPNE